MYGNRQSINNNRNNLSRETKKKREKITLTSYALGVCIYLSTG